MENCLFCSIIQHQIPSAVVYEDELILVIRDINPQAPVHLLCMPKAHLAGLDGMQEKDAALIGHLILKISEIAEQQGLAADGYRVISNIGRNGRQSVRHLHFHLIGGRELSETLA
ncbi:MAG: histidine triad nucleotide-binding protein [Negativicutes bacterium]|nr:histidine triad nucleotide-binding protein [Negativicutes bacterium]